MIKRITSSIIGLSVLLFGIIAGSIWFSALVTIAGALAARELVSLANKTSEKKISRTTIIISTTVLICSAHILSSSQTIPNLISYLILALSIASLLWLLTPNKPTLFIMRLLKQMAIVFYSGGFLFHAIVLRNQEQGLSWLILLLAITFVTDTSAFAVGKIFGKRLLAPTISPGKTIEGAIGGLIGSILATVLLAPILPLEISIGQAVALGLSLGLSAQIGDLSESRFKRLANVKDSGSILPGHGGILDRLDSIVLNVIVVYYFLLWDIV